MSRAHKAAPCALDHDPSLDVTTVEQVAGDHATVAQLLGLDVHGGRVRVTAREWRTVVGIVAWGRSRHSEGALEGLRARRSYWDGEGSTRGPLTRPGATEGDAACA